MNLIKEYSEFSPKQELVDQYRKLLDDKYEVIYDKNSGYKMVLVDERLYYLGGPYVSKGRLSARMYFDLTYDEKFHEPSMRRAIKDWIDDNSK